MLEKSFTCDILNIGKETSMSIWAQIENPRASTRGFSCLILA